MRTCFKQEETRQSTAKSTLGAREKRDNIEVQSKPLTYFICMFEKRVWGLYKRKEAFSKNLIPHGPWSHTQSLQFLFESLFEFCIFLILFLYIYILRFGFHSQFVHGLGLVCILFPTACICTPLCLSVWFSLRALSSSFVRLVLMLPLSVDSLPGLFW